MKIGLLIPVNGLPKYRRIYLSIVKYLQKRGHSVVHPLSFNEAMLTSWSRNERNDSFKEYYAQIKKCDIILAECSYQCIDIGYEIADTVHEGKQVIILKREADVQSLRKFDPISTKEKISIYEYQEYNLQKILDQAILLG